MEIKISLDEKDFEALASGKIVTKDPPLGTAKVSIALQDIGYYRMFAIVSKLMADHHDKYYGHEESQY